MRYRNRSDSDLRHIGNVEVDHLLDIHPVNMVGSEDGNQVVFLVLNQIDVLINGVGSASIPTASGPLLGRERAE